MIKLTKNHYIWPRCFHDMFWQSFFPSSRKSLRSLSRIWPQYELKHRLLAYCRDVTSFTIQLCHSSSWDDGNFIHSCLSCTRKPMLKPWYSLVSSLATSNYPSLQFSSIFKRIAPSCTFFLPEKSQINLQVLSKIIEYLKLCKCYANFISKSKILLSQLRCTPINPQRGKTF